MIGAIKYTAQDDMAVRILEGLEDPFATRSQLSIAVMSEMASDLRDHDPGAFNQIEFAYRKHLTRLSPAHALWKYIGKKNNKGEALEFRKPGQRDRPSRHGGKIKCRHPLNYALRKKGNEMTDTIEHDPKLHPCGASHKQGNGEDRATVGSLVRRAKAGGIDEAPKKMQAEIFTHPDRAPKPKQDEEAEDHTTRYSDLVHYFEGVLAASGERKRLAKLFDDIPPLKELTGANWAIDNWLLKNAANALFGESSKIHIMINMLLCVATGTPWGAYEGFQGYAVDDPRDVILFMGEHYEDLLYRINAAIESEGFDRRLVGKHLALVSDVYALDSADGLATMADEIAELDSRPAIIAINPYNLAIDGDEDSFDDVKRSIRGLRALATRYDAAGLVIHHRPGPSICGGSAFCTGMDVTIFCEHFENSRTDEVITSLTQHKNRSADKALYHADFVGKYVDLRDSSSVTGNPIMGHLVSPINPSAVPN